MEMKMRLIAIGLALGMAACAAPPVHLPVNQEPVRSGPLTTAEVVAICPTCAPPPVAASTGSGGAGEPANPYAEVRRPPATVTKYRQAVAESLRDPESARFTGVRVVRTENGRDALCGSVNAKNAYGGYAGADLFYAEMIPVGQGFAAVPFMVRQVGLDYYMKRCG
jgi:hypothetical protein